MGSDSDNKYKMTNAEKEVAQYLDKLGLWWKFEYPLALYDDGDRHRTWYPDFWLPRLGVYVEVCGIARNDYAYREKIYDENGFKVIFLHYYKEPDKWKKFLVDRIQHIQNSRDQDILLMNSRTLFS